MMIDGAYNPGDIETAQRRFRAYADALPFSLEYQGFAAELAGLPTPHVPPAGCLLLARRSGARIGVVALTPAHHDLCRALGFTEIPPYGPNTDGEIAFSKSDYQRRRLALCSVAPEEWPPCA